MPEISCPKLSALKALITQSNYIPWKGYFDSIALVEIFVVYDDMQYTKADWRNRNQIKTKQGLKWLSVPVEVKGKFFQKIRDTKIADKSWNESHWNLIKENYKSAAHFREMKDWIEPLYMDCTSEYLTEVNLRFITAICSFFGINTKIRSSSEFALDDERTQRLVNICGEIGATEYYTGPAAKAYMETERFDRSGIKVCYLDYSGYQEYPQLNPPFQHSVTILDLIFNAGIDSRKYLKHVA